MPHFTAADGANLFFRDEGAGLPVLCLSGLTRTHADFDYLAPHLPDVRLIRMDYRGRGKSDWTGTTTYTVEQEAKDALARAAALSGGGPVEGAARAVLGRYYWDKKLFDFAEEQWTLALKAAPGEALAQAGLAAVLARRGAVREASQRIAALAQAPPDVLAAVVQMLGEALEDFEQSGLWFEDTADAHFAYASLLFRAGKYGESVAPLERTVRLDPKNHVAWNMLGSISMQLGRTARAREAFETSLKLNPEQERTREALRSLTTGAEGADREP